MPQRSENVVLLSPRLRCVFIRKSRDAKAIPRLLRTRSVLPVLVMERYVRKAYLRCNPATARQLEGRSKLH